MRGFLLTFLLMAIFLGSTPFANATVITFDPLASTITQQFPEYVESGFQFTGYFSSFASWGSLDVNYAGSPALFNNRVDNTTYLTRVDGGSFSLDSIDLSEVYNLGSYETTEAVFTGQFTGGGTASYTAVLDLVFGFQAFDFGDLFSDVTSVSWVQTSHYHQFDNVSVDSAPVPEPSTLLLLGSGLSGLAWYGRKRKKV
jgi:hypothetical protein